MAVHVYHPYRQPDAKNYCKPLNGHCSHICVPAPQLTSNSAKTSCMCPNGFKLAKDNLSCVTDRKYFNTSLLLSITLENIYFELNLLKLLSKHEILIYVTIKPA